MANIASGIRQQMIVPTPHHYNGTSCQVNVSTNNSSQFNNKKEFKKRKKVTDKSVQDKKLNGLKLGLPVNGGYGAVGNRIIGQSVGTTGGIFHPNLSLVPSYNRNTPSEIMPSSTIAVTPPENLSTMSKIEACHVCNKKKCFKHIDAK